jgi:hypothetical protein
VWAFASTEGRAKVGNGGGDNGADDGRERQSGSNEVDNPGTERLLPEEIDETMTDLLFGDVPSVPHETTRPHSE